MNTYYKTKRSKTFDILINGVILVLVSFTILYFLPFLLLQVLIWDLILFIIILLAVIVFPISITISTKGIEYSQPFRTFNIDWEGFDKIGKHWFVEGLIIRFGYMVPLKNSFPANVKTYGGTPPFDFIPLSSFSNNWRDSELGQQIKQYAPHLFEKEESAQSA